MPYILGIDQSTQNTKVVLFDQGGAPVHHAMLPHRQIVDSQGWVEHDPQEILENLVALVRQVTAMPGIDAQDILAAGIANQRETAAAWSRATGKPLHNAIVWQCARGTEICKGLEAAGHADRVCEISGAPLSPYFTAAKYAWMLRNAPEVAAAHTQRDLCFGTMDSWLLFSLTGEHKTDPANASRTQLFDLQALAWSDELCELFGVPQETLPVIHPTDSLFGYTNFGGALPRPIPIHAMSGDSQASLYAHGCHGEGQVKTTYGTGSSVMMNTGGKPVASQNGLAASVAWQLGNGRAQYVLEGNVHYSCAIIEWAVRIGLLESPGQAGTVAQSANPHDGCCLVPAFTGLGSPYWQPQARAAFVGMGRTTERPEMVRAAEESIAYQIADMVRLMERDQPGLEVKRLSADGGGSRDRFLMQFQSDILGCGLAVSRATELSAAGVAYMAGAATGLYDPAGLFTEKAADLYTPSMEQTRRQAKLDGWKRAVQRVL